MCMLAFLLCLFPSSQQKSLDSAKSSATDNTAYKLDKIGDKSLKSLKDLWNFAPAKSTSKSNNNPYKIIMAV